MFTCKLYEIISNKPWNNNCFIFLHTKSIFLQLEMCPYDTCSHFSCLSQWHIYNCSTLSFNLDLKIYRSHLLAMTKASTKFHKPKHITQTNI